MTNIIMLVGPGRYRLTRQALETLASCTDPATYSLTIVMDEGDFRTQSLVMRGDSPIEAPTTLLRVSNSGHTISQLKNLGVAWSEQRFGRGDWLYISDSDVAFTPGWLEKLTEMATHTENGQYRLWGGQVHPFHKPRIEEESPVMTEHLILDGPSWLMRWGTWDMCGPFPRTTAPGVCQSEEYPFCQDLIGRLWRIGVIHPHVVYHTGLTHLDGHDCVGRKEREAMIPKEILSE